LFNPLETGGGKTESSIITSPKHIKQEDEKVVKCFIAPGFVFSVNEEHHTINLLLFLPALRASSSAAAPPLAIVKKSLRNYRDYDLHIMRVSEGMGTSIWHLPPQSKS
jgi:hypothetical protein